MHVGEKRETFFLHSIGLEYTQLFELFLFRPLCRHIILVVFGCQRKIPWPTINLVEKILGEYLSWKFNVNFQSVKFCFVNMIHPVLTWPWPDQWPYVSWLDLISHEVRSLIMTWPKMTRPDLAGSALTWIMYPDLTWPGLTRPTLTGPVLHQPEISWNALTLSVLAWPVLTWPLQIWPRPDFDIQSCFWYFIVQQSTKNVIYKT